MPTIPAAYSTTIPPKMFATTPQANRYVDPPRSLSQPITNAAIGQPTRKPTDGVAKTPRPPRPPASRGRPTATSTSSSSTARNPRRAPRTAPASITPIDWAVIGTVKPGGTNAGTRPSAATTPAKVATSARSRELSRGVLTRRSLEAVRGERVTRLEGALLHAGGEPVHPRLGGSVRPTVRVHPP